MNNQTAEYHLIECRNGQDCGAQRFATRIQAERAASKRADELYREEWDVTGGWPDGYCAKNGNGVTITLDIHDC